MPEKVKIVVAINDDIAYQLKHEKVYSGYLPFETIPASFHDTIKKFIAGNIGFDTGPICGMVRLNDKPLSLIDTAFNGDIKVTDILSVPSGAIILELQVSSDLLSCIGMNRALEITALAKEHGDEIELFHNMFYDSLLAGVIPDGEEHVFCFIPRIKQEECARFLRYDKEWNSSYSDILGGVEEIVVHKMQGF